jgi:hypothetical protein
LGAARERGGRTRVSFVGLCAPWEREENEVGPDIERDCKQGFVRVDEHVGRHTPRRAFRRTRRQLPDLLCPAHIPASGCYRRSRISERRTWDEREAPIRSCPLAFVCARLSNGHPAACSPHIAPSFCSSHLSAGMGRSARYGTELRRRFRQTGAHQFMTPSMIQAAMLNVSNAAGWPHHARMRRCSCWLARVTCRACSRAYTVSKSASTRAGSIRGCSSTRSRSPTSSRRAPIPLHSFPILHLSLARRKVTSAINGTVSFGVIPHEHWFQPEWIDEERAREGRERLKDEPYGGTRTHPLSYHQVTHT